MAEEDEDVEQDEVLRRKGHATRSPIGLQQWGADEALAGTQGTAARAHRLAQGQRRRSRDEP